MSILSIDGEGEREMGERAIERHSETDRGIERERDRES